MKTATVHGMQLCIYDERIFYFAEVKRGQEHFPVVDHHRATSPEKMHETFRPLSTENLQYEYMSDQKPNPAS